MKVTIPELIFVKISKTRVLEGRVAKRELVIVEVVTYEQLKELEEIQVLKRDD